MAKLRHSVLDAPLTQETLRPWLEKVVSYMSEPFREQLRVHCERTLTDAKTNAYDPALIIAGANLVEILAEINLDPAGLAAAFIYPLAVHQKWDETFLKNTYSPEIAKLVLGVHQMDALHHLRAYEVDLDDYAHHLDNLRKMLVAMVEDIRVVLIKLGHHIAALESAKEFSPQVQKTLAVEAREVYAPLANRLGVGHLKWQLEDLSFRYLEPDKYSQIAKRVAEKRLDRQRSVDEAIATLTKELKADGIEARVDGRIKHIYSIYRKMTRKNIQYEEVYDVRAMRVLVDKVGDCYAALGTVHRLWPHIPKEFDDYIAAPKPNGYRSLHTAVVGPEGKVLEVQIRTQAMHEESEIGVCAHWAYKEGAKTALPDQNKMKWLHALLEWQKEISNAEDLFNELKNTVTEDRVYVFTPKGEVVDLPKGSTPLDFAYQVHTDLGHRTRGAKVNGRMVPLTYVLNSSDQIEILAQKEVRPGKDWLYGDSGYLFTPRAKAKVRAWFRNQHRDDNIQDGKEYLEKECARLDVGPIDLHAVAEKLNFHTSDDVLAALGRGDLRMAHVIQAAFGHGIDMQPHVHKPDKTLPRKPVTTIKPKDAITIDGVGNLMTTLAQCCSPLPGDSVLGYLVVGKGVSIHRKDCPNIQVSNAEHPEKIIAVNWGGAEKHTYPVNILIHSYDRKDLLRDITSLLSAEKVNVTTIHSKSQPADSTVRMNLTVEVSDLTMLSRVLTRLGSLPNVIECVRSHEDNL
ncbi:MAG: GTP diphosphokinase [Gammaproteobacteria bacterium]